MLFLLLMLVHSSVVCARDDILVIHSWHDILWDRLWEKSLDEGLADQYTLIREDLDAMRLSAEQLEHRTEQIWQIYQQLEPVLVILGDDIALKQFGQRLESDTPVVYLGINHNARIFFEHGRIPRNITGILERPLYQRAVHQIVDILPAATRRLMILNDSTIEQGDITDLKRIFSDTDTVRVENIDIDLKIATTWEEWQQVVLSAADNGYDAILFDSRYLLRDVSGRYVEPEPGVVRWMARHSPVPIFNFYEDSIGPGLSTGGWVVSARRIGELAVDYVLRILNGVKPEQLVPYTFSEGEYIFSREQLAHWGLSLPEELKASVSYTEDLHQLYHFDCRNYPDSICFD